MATKQNKKSKLISLLSGEAPVDLDKLSSALGWQRHTTSAALTRLKQEGYPLQSSRPEGSVRVYELNGDLTPGSKAARKAEAAASAREGAATQTKQAKA